MHVEFLTPADRALLAIQGPEAVKALQQPTTLDLKILYFMRTSVAGIAGAGRNAEFPGVATRGRTVSKYQYQPAALPK